MILLETYDIIDAIYYNSNTISSTQILSVPNIPTNFKCRFKTKGIRTATSGGMWIEVGANSNNLLLFGNTSSESKEGIFIKVNNSYSAFQQGNSVLSSDDVTHEYSYDNGLQTITANGENTVTLNNSQITDRSYIRAFIKNTGTYIKEIMFLPL